MTQIQNQQQEEQTNQDQVNVKTQQSLDNPAGNPTPEESRKSDDEQTEAPSKEAATGASL